MADRVACPRRASWPGRTRQWQGKDAAESPRRVAASQRNHRVYRRECQRQHERRKPHRPAPTRRPWLQLRGYMPEFNSRCSRGRAEVLDRPSPAGGDRPPTSRRTHRGHQVVRRRDLQPTANRVRLRLVPSIARVSDARVSLTKPHYGSTSLPLYMSFSEEMEE